MAMTPCDCAYCPDGVPQNWQVTISGTSNNTCAQCTNINGVYTLVRGTDVVGGCRWGGPGMSCSYTFQLTIGAGATPGTVDMKLVAIGAPPIPTWTRTNV